MFLIHKQVNLIHQAGLMISLIWKYYSDPVTVVPNKWIAPVERLVAFPTGVAGDHSVLYDASCINQTFFLPFIFLS